MASSRAAASLICRPSSCPLPVPVAATMLSLSHTSTGRPRFLASTSAYTPASSPSSTSGEYFLNTTCPSAAVKISSASPWRMRWVRLISLGMTTRPSSSILRTIPVAFIGVPSCPSIFCTIYLLYGKCGGLCMVRACFLSVLYPALPAGHHAERLGNVGVHACFKHLFAVSLKAISILEIL